MEGTDGVGKTTQAKSLIRWLKGKGKKNAFNTRTGRGASFRKNPENTPSSQLQNGKFNRALSLSSGPN